MLKCEDEMKIYHFATASFPAFFAIDVEHCLFFYVNVGTSQAQVCWRVYMLAKQKDYVSAGDQERATKC